MPETDNTKGAASNGGSLNLSELKETIISGFDVPSKKPEKSTEQILREFQSWDEANTALWNACNNGKPPMGVSVESVDGCVNAVFNTIAVIDKFGKAIAQGGTCSVCGKHINYVPLNGYCSVECFIKDLLKRVAFNKKSKNTSKLDQLLESIQSVIDFLNLVMNCIMELPEKLKNLVMLPPAFRNFMQIRINIIFAHIKLLINQLMIFKNNCIIEILKPIQIGIITDKIASLMPPINAVIATVNALHMTLDTTFGMLIKMMQNPMFSIPPESYVWAMTPRSIMRMPQLYIEVPVNMNLPINMFGPLTMLNIEAINNTIKELFPPITAPEYFLEPEIFDVRLALSDQSDIVKEFAESLELILKFGPEYLPRYKDLKLTNPWYLLAMIVGWGPKAQICYGSFINPMA